MFEKLIFLLSALTIILFLLNLFFKGNTVESCLLFILALLPLMDLKITSEAFGGFKTFDFICFYALLFLLKDFIKINLRSRNDVYLVLFVVLGVIILIGGMASEFPDKALLNLIKALPIFIFGRFLVITCVKDPGFHLKAVNALKVSYLLALGFLLLQMLIGLKFTFYPGLSPNTIDPVFKVVRYPGIFYDSQAHGQFLAMGSFLFLYLEKSASNTKKWLSYGIFVLIILAIIVAGSRAALGGFLVGLVIVIFLASKQYRVYGLIVMVAGAAIIGIFSPQAGMFDRAKNLSEDYLFRQSIWLEAFEISKKHPYLGIGSGNYKNYVILHAQNQYLELEDGVLVYFDQPENGYLKIMVELGFIGFSIYLLFVLLPLLKGFIYQVKGIYDKKVTFFMASLICFLVAFNTVYSIYDNRLLIMVASMAILIITYPKSSTYGLIER